MKITASKKTITILSLCVLVLLIGGLIFSFKEIIKHGFETKRWFLVDKYEELFDDCRYSKTENEVRVTCNALLHQATEIDKEIKEHCYNFVTIPKDNSKATYLINMCVKDEDVKWQGLDAWLEKPRMSPVKYTLIFNKDKLFHYNYSHLEIVDATEKDLHEEFFKNEDAKQYMSRTNTEYPDSYMYQNYVIHEKDFFSRAEMGQLNLFKTTLLDWEQQENKIVLTFKVRIKDKNITLAVETEAFTLFPTEDLQIPFEVNKDNVEEMKENNEYGISLLFFNNMTEGIKEEIKAHCSSEEQGSDILFSHYLCKNKEILLDNSFKATTEEELVSKLLNNSTKPIKIENTVLYNVYNLSD